eukprot:tig00000459_g1146.t1
MGGFKCHECRSVTVKYDKAVCSKCIDKEDTGFLRNRDMAHDVLVRAGTSFGPSHLFERAYLRGPRCFMCSPTLLRETADRIVAIMVNKGPDEIEQFRVAALSLEFKKPIVFLHLEAENIPSTSHEHLCSWYSMAISEGLKRAAAPLSGSRVIRYVYPEMYPDDDETDM